MRNESKGWEFNFLAQKKKIYKTKNFMSNNNLCNVLGICR